MKKVMCFGTFDVLHKGHEFYLKKAKKFGDYLVVVVALDDTVMKVKKHLPKNNQEKRIENLQRLGIADEVVLGNEGDKLKVIEDEKPDIICFGYDQKVFTENIKEKLQKLGLNVMIARLPSYNPDIYKSSFLKNNY